jgi:hypothetical protein
LLGVFQLRDLSRRKPPYPMFHHGSDQSSAGQDRGALY